VGSSEESAAEPSTRFTTRAEVALEVPDTMYEGVHDEPAASCRCARTVAEGAKRARAKRARAKRAGRGSEQGEGVSRARE
jgi:hypothetical protein